MAVYTNNFNSEFAENATFFVFVCIQLKDKLK